MKTSINLDPNQNSIQGLFSPNSEILVMCDATLVSFAVEMPDAYSTDTTTFRFIKKDGTANTITINAKANQKIMNEDSQVLTLQADELVLNSDGENWW